MTSLVTQVVVVDLQNHIGGMPAFPLLPMIYDIYRLSFFVERAARTQISAHCRLLPRRQKNGFNIVQTRQFGFQRKNAVELCREFVTFLLLSLAGMTVHGFSSRATPPKRRGKVQREDLPTLDIPKGSPLIEAPNGVSASQFYLPTYTLLRAGPVSFLRRIADGKSYEQ